MAGCHIYRSKDFVGWYGLGLYLYNSRTVFCSWSSVREYGCSTCWATLFAPTETYHSVLSSIVRKSKVWLISSLPFFLGVWSSLQLLNQLFLTSLFLSLPLDFLLSSLSKLFFVLLLCRACDALRSCLPDMLRDATFSTFLVVSISFIHSSVYFLKIFWMSNNPDIHSPFSMRFCW